MFSEIAYEEINRRDMDNVLALVRANSTYFQNCGFALNRVGVSDGRSFLVEECKPEHPDISATDPLIREELIFPLIVQMLKGTRESFTIVTDACGEKRSIRIKIEGDINRARIVTARLFKR